MANRIVCGWYVHFLTFCFLYSCSYQTSSVSNNTSHQFSTIWEKHFFTVEAIDLDQDGQDELVYDLGEQIDVRNVEHTRYYASFIKKRAFRQLSIPLVTGQLDTLQFLFKVTTDSIIIIDRWTIWAGGKEEARQRRFLTFTGKDLDGDGMLHLSLYPRKLFVDSSGKRLFLLSLDSGGDMVRRGVIAIDLRAGEKVWEYFFGPQITSCKIDDFDADGKQEIFIGTYAPANGAQWNGMPDDRSYILMLNEDGSLRWKRQMGGMFSGAFVDAGDFDGDGRRDLIAYRFRQADTTGTQDEIMRIDPATGEILLRRHVGLYFSYRALYRGSFCRDFNGDGRDEFVVGNSDGLIRMFDGDLNIIATSERFGSKVTIFGVGFLNDDYQYDVLCFTEDGNYHILDHQLQLLHSWKPVPFGIQKIVHGRKKSYILTKSARVVDSFGMPLYQLLELRRLSLPAYMIRNEQKYLGLILLFLVLLVFVIFTRNAYYGRATRKLLLQALRHLELHEQALVLRANGQIEHMGEAWRTFLEIPDGQWHGRKWQQLVSSDPANAVASAVNRMLHQKGEPRVQEIVLHRPGGDLRLRLAHHTVPVPGLHFFFLEDLTEKEQVRHMRSWAPLAQRMAHGIKNPLTTVKLNAEELRRILAEQGRLPHPEIDEYFDAIISQTNRLTRISDRFMRFVRLERPDLRPVDVNALVREWIPQWLPERDDRVRVSYALENHLPPAWADPEQLEFALKTVFYNALESLGEKGTILISTRLVQVFPETGNTIRQEFVELQIRDTGCGIPPEILAKIGQPYVSTKREGTGLGISIVQKIMHEHGGTFDIHSEVDVGTTVTLRLQVATGSQH